MAKTLIETNSNEWWNKNPDDEYWVSVESIKNEKFFLIRLMLKFITGNKNKFLEAQHLFGEGNIEQLDIDLPEIQDVDPKKVIEAKLQEAFRHDNGPFFIDDNSFVLDKMNGLPGPFIRWFLQSLGVEGFADLAARLEDNSATVSSLIGYAQNPDSIQFFEASITGHVVAPRGEAGFGWDKVFQPAGWDQTFGQWKETNPGPNALREEAMLKLKKHLDNPI